MKKGYIKLLIISLLIILFLTLNNIFNILNIYTLILILFIILITNFYILGYQKNNQRYQKDIMLTVLIYSVIYIIITNIIGIFVGFNKTGYNLTFIPILINIAPVILIIILSEFIRYIIITKGNTYKIIYVLAVIIFVLLDITLIINRYKLNVLDEFINFIIAVVLPSISRNIMLIYLTGKVGYRPTILYRFIFELPTYFLPIFPDFGIYIGSILQIVSPAILLYIVYRNFEQIKNKKTVIRKRKFSNEKVGLIVLSIVIIIIIYLSSGWFKYHLLTIGSGSMTGTINKGDIVIVKKLDNEEIESLKVGDILVFSYSERIIVHRIVRILIVPNNEYYFYTKGDYNEAEDGQPVEEKDIVGTTMFRIPYLGYPTVLLNELINSGP